MMTVAVKVVSLELPIILHGSNIHMCRNRKSITTELTLSWHFVSLKKHSSDFPNLSKKPC